MVDMIPRGFQSCLALGHCFSVMLSNVFVLGDILTEMFVLRFSDDCFSDGAMDV